MESKKTMINVCYTSAHPSQEGSTYLKLQLKSDSSYGSMIRKIKDELRRTIELNKFPDAYSLNIDLSSRPLKSDKRVTLWKYWYRNRITGQKTNPSYIESINNRVPVRSELNKNSRLGDFSDTWELQIERTDRRKVNNKWIEPNELADKRRERDAVRIVEKVEKSKIERTIVRGGIYRRETLNNPDFQEEVRFSWQFLLAS